MSIQQQLTHEALTIFQNVTGLKIDSLQGHWVCISIRDWISFLHDTTHNDNTATQGMRLTLLDFIAEKINQHTFGAGSHYELYEARRLEELGYFLSVLSMTEEEASYFKEKTEYSDDSCACTMCCEQCGNEDSAFASAKSLQMEGVELCTHCLNSRYC